jgi:hypothetical protein
LARDLISLGETRTQQSLPFYEEIILSFNQPPMEEVEVESLRRLTLELDGSDSTVSTTGHNVRGLYRLSFAERVENLPPLSDGFSLFQLIQAEGGEVEPEAYNRGQLVQRSLFIESAEPLGPVV